MAVQNNKKNGIKNRYTNPLTCDVCNSKNIVETIEGFVCKDCGIVLEIEKLAYHNPYNINTTHYARLNDYTNIGTSLERISNPHSVKLKRFQKQQLIVENEKRVAMQAKLEIGRIFGANSYPDQLKEKAFELFKDLRKKVKEKSKYRSVEKLVPLSIYVCFKLENMVIDESELLEVSEITQKDFNAFKLQLSQILPKYKARNRENYVLGKVYELMEYFNLEMGFYFRAQKALTKLWNGIKNTTDLVIAGLVSAISILCSDQKNNISINALCKRLGIRMSTVQSQVKKQVFDRFKINDFISLMKSSSVLKKIMIRLGVIEEINSEIRFGNAIQVFNRFDDQNYSLYLIASDSNCIVLSLKKDFNRKSALDPYRFKIAYELSVMNLFPLGSGPPTVDPG